LIGTAIRPNVIVPFQIERGIGIALPRQAGVSTPRRAVSFVQTDRE
jgi:hypothetical protein